jgi:hypothetical protein
MAVVLWTGKNRSKPVGIDLCSVSFILVPGLLGFWRGRRERTSKYMVYLLSALPEETQNSLVDLAFEEVREIVEARRSSPQHSRSET